MGGESGVQRWGGKERPAEEVTKPVDMETHFEDAADLETFNDLPERVRTEIEESRRNVRE